jgi:transposase
MPKTRAPYPKEFREEAVRLVRTRTRPVTEIARELEVAVETLRVWVKRADVDAGLRHDAPTTPELEEIRRLRREVRELREVREILTKAAAFFATEQTRR